MSTVEEVNKVLRQLISMYSNDEVESISSQLRGSYCIEERDFIEPAIWDPMAAAVRKSEWIIANNNDELVQRIDCKKYCKKLMHLKKVFEYEETEDEDSDKDGSQSDKITKMFQMRGYTVYNLDSDNEDDVDKYDCMYIRVARRICNTMQKFWIEAVEKGKLRREQNGKRVLTFLLGLIPFNIRSA